MPICSIMLKMLLLCDVTDQLPGCRFCVNMQLSKLCKHTLQSVIVGGSTKTNHNRQSVASHSSVVTIERGESRIFNYTMFVM